MKPLTIPFNYINYNSGIQYLDFCQLTGLAHQNPPIATHYCNDSFIPTPAIQKTEDTVPEPIKPGLNIVVVDTRIEDFSSVLLGISPGFEVFLLDYTQDGIHQITDILIKNLGVSSLHIVSHGESGCLQLGTARLDLTTFDFYANDLQWWKMALQPEAEILLYGCNVASNDRGVDFIQKLSEYLEANIAASINLTGSQALGGDWELQFTTGEIKSSLAIQPWLKESYDAVLHTGTPTFSLPLLPLITSGTPIARINAGGSSYVDSLGRNWSADQNFVGTSYSYAINQAIAGTNDSPLYQDERSGMNGSSFAYQFSVLPGIYNINLHFAELYWQQAGKRIFDVDIEGESFLNDFDILLEGGAKKAITKSTRVAVTDGTLNINFDSLVDNAQVTALEILREGDIPSPSSTAGTLAFSAPTYTVNENGTPVTAVTVTRTQGSSGAVSATINLTEGTATAPADYNNTPITVNFADGDTAPKTITIPIVNDTIVESTETINLTLGNPTGGAVIDLQNKATLSILDNDSLAKILINTGGGQYTDSAGQVWSADQYFTGTSYTYAITSAIAGTNDPALYQNERSGVNGSPFSYQIPVTNGQYLVNLNFAEIYWNQPGKRVFNVNLEGQSILQNFDIWSQVGQNRALTKSAQTTVNDGVLNIDFSALVDNAEITSIEILKVSDPLPPTIAGAIAFSAPSFSVNEDGTSLAAVTVTRTGGSSGAVSVVVTPSNGTASAPADYNNAPITVSFANGDTTPKTVIIPIVNDTIQERVEGINLTLSNVTGGAVLGNQTSAILSIVDNDLNSGFTSLTWATEVSATEPTSESLRAIVDGKLYVFGGFNTNDFVSSTSQRVSVYEPATNTWKRLGDMPTKLTHSPSVVDGHNVYFIGGYDGLHPKNYGTSIVWKYDTLQDNWTTFVPLPVPKGAGAAVLLGREIHFFGGMNQDRTINSGDHFVLNLDAPNPTWRTAAPMPNPRNHLGGVALNGKAYAVGGQLFEEDKVIVQTQVDVYDPVTNTWTTVASLPKPRSQMGEATFVMDGRIIVAGGEDYYNHALADVTAYDPVTNKWTELTPLPAPRRSGVAGVIGSEFIYSTGWNYQQNNTTWSGLPLGSPPVNSSGTFAFSSPTYTVNENGTPVTAITITRSGGSSGAVSVTLTPSNGTAIAPNDYNNSPIVVNFASGETSKIVTIHIIDDTLVETTENLNLILSNATGGATIGAQNTAILSILDNDGLTQLQINTGGGQYTDTLGQIWLADQYFTGSTNTYKVTQAIAGTTSAPLYQDERYGQNFGYNIPVNNGTYIIDLNFAELYWNAAGKRIFNVTLEGQTVLQNFDIWSQAGGQYKALTKSFQVTVTDGFLNLNFSTSVDNAQITSLRLMPASSPSSSSGVLALSDPLVLPVA